MKYTIAQFDKHEDLIREYDKDPSIIIQYKTVEAWADITTVPTFDVRVDFRKKPTPIFTNDLGEEFTQEDIGNGIKVFYFRFIFEDLDECGFQGVKEEDYLEGFEDCTQISKTKQGALQLAIKEMNKLNN